METFFSVNTFLNSEVRLIDMLSLSERKPQGERVGWSKVVKRGDAPRKPVYNEVRGRMQIQIHVTWLPCHQNAWLVVFCFFLQSFTTTALSLIKDDQRSVVCLFLERGPIRRGRVIRSTFEAFYVTFLYIPEFAIDLESTCFSETLPTRTLRECTALRGWNICTDTAPPDRLPDGSRVVLHVVILMLNGRATVMRL